jgi:hypothetical protein
VDRQARMCASVRRRAALRRTQKWRELAELLSLPTTDLCEPIWEFGAERCVAEPGQRARPCPWEARRHQEIEEEVAP